MIRSETHGGVVVAYLEHGKANALDLELCRALVQWLHDIAASDARAAVITAKGGIFSAGVDLVRLLDEGPDYRIDFVPAISVLVRALFTFPKPLVAAVNGHAVAGGCLIACCADHRIMAHGPGRIGVPELLVGVPFPTAPLEVMRFVTAPQDLQNVVYGGRTYLADEALAVGLIDQVCDSPSLMKEAMAAADRLAALPPRAFLLAKRQLREPVLERMDAGAERDIEVERAWNEEETLARVRAYVERTFKRPE